MKISNDISFEDFSKTFETVPPSQAIKIIEIQLKIYEQKYHMSSNAFYENLESGLLEETFDFGLWKSKIDTYRYYKKGESLENLQINDIVKVSTDCKGFGSDFLGDYGRIFSSKNGVYGVIFSCRKESVSWEEEFIKGELIKVGHDDDASLYVEI